MPLRSGFSNPSKKPVILWAGHLPVWKALKKQIEAICTHIVAHKLKCAKSRLMRGLA
jgi:hypothetical protein